MPHPAKGQGKTGRELGFKKVVRRPEIDPQGHAKKAFLKDFVTRCGETAKGRPMPFGPHVPQTHVPRHIFVTLVGTGIVAIAAIAILAFWMAKATNEIASENAKRLLESSIGAELTRVEITTGDYGNWNEAYEWLIARDGEAILANLGTGATESNAFDLLYISDVNGTPLYAYETGGQGSDLSLVDRDLLSLMANEVNALPRQQYETTSHIAFIDGRLTLIGASRIQPIGLDDLDFSQTPVIVGGIWLTQSQLEKIGEKLLIDNLSIMRGSGVIAPTTGAVGLVGIDGQTVATLRFDLPRPGSQLLARALPTILATSLLLLAGSLLVGRASAAQTRRFLQEHEKARTDPLTGLMNRAGVNELAENDEIMAAIAKGNAAVLYLDINGFKALNDTVGHDGGDRALEMTAERLRRSMRQGDILARLGGDEFVALILDPSPESAAQAVCDRIIMQTDLPMRIGQESHLVRTSIGAAVARAGSDWNGLVIEADAAMYRAKKSSVSRPVFFTDDMRAHNVDAGGLERVVGTA